MCGITEIEQIIFRTVNVFLQHIDTRHRERSKKKVAFFFVRERVKLQEPIILSLLLVKNTLCKLLYTHYFSDVFSFRGSNQCNLLKISSYHETLVAKVV